MSAFQSEIPIRRIADLNRDLIGNSISTSRIGMHTCDRPCGRVYWWRKRRPSRYERTPRCTHSIVSHGEVSTVGPGHNHRAQVVVFTARPSRGRHPGVRLDGQTSTLDGKDAMEAVQNNANIAK